MTNPVNTNSDQIVFHFMDHIIIMRKEYLWDCLFPGQYSRNFYRIWTVHLQKAVAKVEH